MGIEPALQGRHRVSHRLRERDVEVEEHEGMRTLGGRRARRWRRKLAGGLGRVPGRDHGDGRVASEDPGEAGALPVDGSGRTPKEHGEGRRLSEVLSGEVLPTR
jgi:hypothetical protein